MHHARRSDVACEPPVPRQTTNNKNSQGSHESDVACDLCRVWSAAAVARGAIARCRHQGSLRTARAFLRRSPHSRTKRVVDRAGGIGRALRPRPLPWPARARTTRGECAAWPVRRPGWRRLVRAGRLWRLVRVCRACRPEIRPGVDAKLVHLGGSDRSDAVESPHREILHETRSHCRHDDNKPSGLWWSEASLARKTVVGHPCWCCETSLGSDHGLQLPRDGRRGSAIQQWGGYIQIGLVQRERLNERSVAREYR